MSAVIRIKRHIDEEPLSAFLLNCKRRKTGAAIEDNRISSVEQNGAIVENDASKENTTQILKFSGTLTNPNDLPQHILKIKKDEAKELITKLPRPVNVTAKSRQQHKASTQNNRFKVVNCTRSLETVEEAAAASANPVTILDVEKDTAANRPDGDGDDEEKFVFDVYVSDQVQNDRIASDNLLDLEEVSVVEYVDTFAYDNYRDANDKMSDSEQNSDDEDSNDENFWRNDYPDEDDYDEDSIGDEDMRRAVEDFDIGDGRELSSDDDDNFGGEEDDKPNGFVYSVDSEAIGFEDDLDYCDVNRYGEAYARYKRKYLRHSGNNYLPINYSKDDEDGSDDYSD